MPDDAVPRPALRQMLSLGSPCPPFECCDCPFATVSPNWPPPNPADPGEGHYDCALLDRKAVWGEDPACELADWKKRASAELEALTPLTREQADAWDFATKTAGAPLGAQPRPASPSASERPAATALDVALTMREDEHRWCVIERAEHDGKAWLEQIEPGVTALRLSSRIGNADIEGSSSEMLVLARAILDGGSASFRRCAAETTRDGVLLWSPRNSLAPTLVAHARAQALARDVVARLGKAPP